MLILAIDSAGSGCSAAVLKDGAVLALAEEKMERGQDSRLMPLILEVMKKAGAGFGDIDRVAVTRGPGSFTGLRIGLAAARGIGLAAGKPVIGIERFAIYREQTKNAKGDFLAVIDSRRRELYCRFYPAKGEAQEPQMLAPEEIKAFAAGKNIIIAGDRPDLLTDLDVRAPSENEAVTCARSAALADPADAQFRPSPLYIRPPDVTVKKAV